MDLYPYDLPVPTHEPGDVQRTARRILARPEYKFSDEPGLVQRLIRDAGDWVARQLSRFSVSLGLPPVPEWLGWAVLGVLLALLVILIYRTRARWLHAGSRPRTTRGGATVVVAADEDAMDWAAEVVRCEAEGAWREGLRARYRVLVGELAARGIIPDLAGRTAGEFVADVRVRAPGAARAFAAATAVFEEVWYGRAPCGPAERDRFAALADEAWARIPAERRAGRAGPAASVTAAAP